VEVHFDHLDYARLYARPTGTRGDLGHQRILQTAVHWGNFELHRNSQHFGTLLRVAA
jgi:hypothetical protein